MNDDTFVAWLLRILEEKPKSPQDVVRRLHDDWGGARPYIPKKNSVETRVSLLGAAIAAGKPKHVAFQEAGVSRRNGFRLLGRRWPVK